ncbi:unnamed protein product [Toxocara canis]|uniref:BOWMAN_BIRK domain-containing protein n=1 Tax=Toxocara canis TaxID=6265 RepID=A0A183TZK2_TOXCA|nr:unnamed protein product [Toxocara canis]
MMVEHFNVGIASELKSFPSTKTNDFATSAASTCGCCVDANITELEFDAHRKHVEKCSKRQQCCISCPKRSEGYVVQQSNPGTQCKVVRVLNHVKLLASGRG